MRHKLVAIFHHDFVESTFLRCKSDEKSLGKCSEHRVRASVAGEWSGVGHDHGAVQRLEDVSVLVGVVIVELRTENVTGGEGCMFEVDVGHKYSAEQPNP